MDNFRINCKMCLSFIKEFFVKDMLSVTTMDHLLEHLLICPDCYEKYKQFATENKYEFNLREKALDFVDSYDYRTVLITRDKLKELGFQRDIKEQKKKWENTAKKFKIDKLMQLQFFKDLMNETIEAKDEDFVKKEFDYCKYIAIKVCKNIDLLEACYNISKGDDKDEKS